MEQQNNVPNQAPQNAALIASLQMKNLPAAIALALFFGPLGLMYSSVKAGLIAMPIVFLVIFFTFGLGFFIAMPSCAICAYVLVSKQNQEILKSLGQ